jgi:hypothetical protein
VKISHHADTDASLLLPLARIKSNTNRLLIPTLGNREGPTHLIIKKKGGKRGKKRILIGLRAESRYWRPGMNLEDG